MNLYELLTAHSLYIFFKTINILGECGVYFEIAINKTEVLTAESNFSMEFAYLM